MNVVNDPDDVKAEPKLCWRPLAPAGRSERESGADGSARPSYRG
jgi:hypothetical protein